MPITFNPPPPPRLTRLPWPPSEYGTTHPQDPIWVCYGQHPDKVGERGIFLTRRPEEPPPYWGGVAPWEEHDPTVNYEGLDPRWLSDPSVLGDEGAVYYRTTKVVRG